jgi:23S rRNA (uracil1939-C5)-methyltransferase
MAEPGSILTLDVEKPAAGGRMLARHHGQVVLVSGAIPGERVAARVERSAKGLIFAETTGVISASGDRRPVAHDWRCGGNVLAHVAYARQLQLKADIIRDAFGRIGRIPLSAVPDVMGSPEQGYRMRARLHAQDGRLGFFREGTHQLCDAPATAQLLEATNGWIARTQATLSSMPPEIRNALTAVEVAENIPGDQRACHLELRAGADAAPFRVLADGLAGVSAQSAGSGQIERLVGSPSISDMLRPGEDRAELRLRRNVRAFFQANRFLLERLVDHVTTVVPPGPVVDLYAGVGLFGLSLAASGREAVTAVEGDPVSSADLQTNSEPFGDRVRLERRSVEAFLGVADKRIGAASFIVDPPRTGLSKAALAGMIRVRPRTIVYVSCDVATLARDSRTLLDAGYELRGLTGIDLFPNTAHVESVAVFGWRS